MFGLEKKLNFPFYETSLLLDFFVTRAKHFTSDASGHQICGFPPPPQQAILSDASWMWYSVIQF